MATPVDRSALRPRWKGLVLIALGSCAAIVAVLLLQAQQLRRLNSSLHTGSELRMVEMQRQETEYLQLREAWQRALNPMLPLDTRALALRYEIWVGRVAMLRDNTATRRTAISALPALDTTMAMVDRFISEADTVLAGDTEGVRRAALTALEPQLVALGEPRLALAAAHRATNNQTDGT
jgi:hypothetical protein